MSNDFYNLAVIGAGSGGLVSAAGASGMGARVVLIEKHKMGGDCLNTGCVPSKALIKSAKVAAYLKHAVDYGFDVSGYQADFKRIMERVQAKIAKIEPHDSPERFRSLGVQVEFGPGSFVSKNEVTNGEKTFKAKRIVIATGSRPRVPEIKGIESTDYLTSDTIWEIRELPKRFVVIGGGPIGCEIAQCFSRFGSKVTVVGRDKRLLPRDDEDASQIVMETFRAEGIQLELGQNPESIEKTPDGYSMTLKNRETGESKTIAFDRMLVAAGRTPNLEGLNLEKVGVKTTARGIEVNSYLQTSVPHIFACGDIAGPYLFTHTADYQARTILRNALFPGKSKVDYRVVPWATYTDPEVAQVGMTAAQAEERGVDFEVTEYSLTNLDRAICDGADKGFVKVVTEKGSDQILGATLVGEHAGDLMHEFVVAMKANVGLKGIAGTIHAYPTLAEGPKRTADAWMRKKLTPTTAKILKRYFEWLR